MRLLNSQKEIVPPRRESTKFDLLYLSHRYPPKYVVALAYKTLSGSLLHGFRGGAETNNFLLARGFVIVDKDENRVRIEPVPENEESTFPEGTERYQMHRTLERDSKIARRAKENRLKCEKSLSCDVCGFCFQRAYGGLGVGFIEAHHMVPVSELRGNRKTKLSEIALVCSNCHRMLHRERPWLSIKDLRDRLVK